MSSIYKMKAEKAGLDFAVPLKGVVTSMYGMRIHPVDGVQKMHYGVDIAPRPKKVPPIDIPVQAAEDGVVTFAGKMRGYGNTVIVTHKDGFQTLYAHLKEPIFAQKDQNVRQGNSLGIAGNTGRGSGIHLHFEIIHNSKKLNPSDFIEELQLHKAVKPSLNAANQAKEAQSLQIMYDVNGKEKMEPGVMTGVDLKRYNKPTQQAALYSMSKGDMYAALTFLSEGVDGRAFYYDPASGGKNGHIINIHPGINLSAQSDETIKKVLKAGQIDIPFNEIIGTIRNRSPLTAKMKAETLNPEQVHETFGVVRQAYTDTATRALERVAIKNPLVIKMMKEDKLTKREATEAVINNMPEGAWAVLQHAAYKKGNLNGMEKVLTSAINAALDKPENQQKHLSEGAQYINYVYKHNGVTRNDTRVESLHRLFFVAGDKMDRETSMKVLGGKDLGAAESMLDSMAKASGTQAAMKGGKFNIPEEDAEIAKWRRQGIQLTPDEKAFSQKSPVAGGASHITPKAEMNEAMVNINSITPTPDKTPTPTATPKAEAQETVRKVTGFFMLGDGG